MANLTGAKLDEYVQNSDTCQFYKNKTLFITGVTGFCGKVSAFCSYWNISNIFQIYFNCVFTVIASFLSLYVQVFFEKIARVLFPVKRIYVLIRSKKDQTAQERLNELLSSKIFSFHQYSVNQLNKFVAVNGDCSQPDMGLSDEDKQRLIGEVNIVFHCAASVKFDAPVP